MSLHILDILNYTLTHCSQPSSRMSQTMEITIINLCPHALVVYDRNVANVLLSLPGAEKPCRVRHRNLVFGFIKGIPVRYSEYGAFENLPEPIEGSVFVVSGMVARVLMMRGDRRDDIYTPDITPRSGIRDSQGRPVGCRGLRKLVDIS